MCWRGSQKVGMYFCMWWERDNILNVWLLNVKEMKEIIKLNIKSCSKIPLLWTFIQDQWNWTRKELLSTLLTVARLTIIRNWEIKYDLQLKEWYMKTGI